MIKIKPLLLILGALAVTGLLVWGMMWLSASKNERNKNATSREVAMLCTTDMATQFHIHPELKILILGGNFALPADIGITNGCMHSLHTHDNTGVLHVEAPIKKDFTLGDFFAVWNKPFDKNHLMQYSTGDGHKITMTINGNLVDTYENTILKDDDKIVISLEYAVVK